MNEAPKAELETSNFSACPTRRYLIEEKDGTLLLRKPGMHYRTMIYALWGCSRIIWVVAAALPLAGIVPVPGDGNYAVVSAICCIVTLFTNFAMMESVLMTGPVVSTVQESLRIGHLPDGTGYRGTNPRRPLLEVDDVAIPPGRLVRVAVGFIEPEQHARKHPLAFTVNLVMIDGIVTVEEFDDEILARRMATGLASVLCVLYDPSELPWYNFFALTGKEALKWVVSTLVHVFFILLILGTAASVSSFSPWRWEAAVAGSLLFDVAIRKYLVVRLMRAEVERVAREAFRFEPRTSK